MRRAIALLLLLGCSKPQPTIILATTTSVQDSGLLDELLPAFEGKTGVRVKPVAVGSGEAIAMARRGAADVVLAHSPAAEQALVEEGFALDRRTIMTNTFLVVGPADDPAKVREAKDPRDAFARIVGRTFVSRGDKSGTHTKELSLWPASAVRTAPDSAEATAGKPTPPSGAWYVESGGGMGETLLLADQKSAYTLSDIATYLAMKPRLKLEVLFDKGNDLVNRYSVMRVTGGSPEGATFVEWMSTEALPLVAEFGKAKYGRALFVPESR